MFKKIFKLFKKPLYLALLAALIFAGGGVYFYLNSGQKSSADFVLVKKGEIRQEVSVTGRVEAAQSVNLAFEKSGKVNGAPAKVGEQVKTGQLLASLSNGDLVAQVAQAQASLQKEEIKLQELKNGTRNEDLAVAQTTVDNAKKTLTDVKEKAAVDLDNLYEEAKDVLNDSYVKADDAVNKQTNDFFDNDTSASPSLTFTTDSQYETDSEWQRWLAGSRLLEFKSEIENISSNQNDLDEELDRAENHLKIARDFLNTTSSALNSATNIVSATLYTYKGYLNTGRTNVATALTNVNSQKQSIAAQKSVNQSNITTAQNTLSVAEENLNLKKAGSTPEEIGQQEAQVKYAQANVENYQAQLSKTVIRASFDGLVVKQDAKVGEIVAANANLVSLISNAQFEVEANVPEADIAKVKIGNSARITLDAYGSDVIFEARVISIEPAETMVESVATYKIKLQFLKEDERIKSGMTSNIDIETQRLENVLVLPQRLLTQKNNERFVSVLKSNGEIEERKIGTGIKGVDSNIEIVSGLSEGEKVVVAKK